MGVPVGAGVKGDRVGKLVGKLVGCEVGRHSLDVSHWHDHLAARSWRVGWKKGMFEGGIDETKPIRRRKSDN